MTLIGIQEVSHFWEGIGILVGLGIWIGAAGMYQYLKRHPEKVMGAESSEEKIIPRDYHRWFLPVVDLDDLGGVDGVQVE